MKSRGTAMIRSSTEAISIPASARLSAHQKAAYALWAHSPDRVAYYIETPTGQLHFLLMHFIDSQGHIDVLHASSPEISRYLLHHALDTGASMLVVCRDEGEAQWFEQNGFVRLQGNDRSLGMVSGNLCVNGIRWEPPRVFAVGRLRRGELLTTRPQRINKTVSLHEHPYAVRTRQGTVVTATPWNRPLPSIVNMRTPVGHLIRDPGVFPAREAWPGLEQWCADARAYLTHSPQANVTVDPDGGVRATRDIRPGEELLYAYGVEHWTEFLYHSHRLARLLMTGVVDSTSSPSFLFREVAMRIADHLKRPLQTRAPSANFERYFQAMAKLFRMLVMPAPAATPPARTLGGITALLNQMDKAGLDALPPAHTDWLEQRVSQLLNHAENEDIRMLVDALFG